MNFWKGDDAVNKNYPEAQKMEEKLNEKEKDFEKLDKKKEKAEKAENKQREKEEKEKKVCYLLLSVGRIRTLSNSQNVLS